MMTTRRSILGTAVLLVACQPADADPQRKFDALEDRLVAARTVRVDFRVTAEGAMEVDLTGTLQLGADDTALLEAKGHFAGQSIDVALTATAEAFALGDRPHLLSADAPEHLEEALLIGFTRMGVLHSLARLVAGAPPDHAEGGVREWAVVDAFATEEGGSGAIVFELTVAGEPSGSASLEIGTDGYPVVRRQTVHFPNGEMRVMEAYSEVTIEP